MEALELAVRLLEKVSVMVAAVLMLVMIRPAGVWLGETGSRASIRRRLFLIVILGGLAIWGSFLGFSVGGLGFNVRMVGIIVAGYLGGIGVGMVVGTAAGIVYASTVPDLAAWVLMASVMVGGLAGLWSRQFGTRLASVVVGTIAIQGLYHAAVGAIMAAFDLEMALTLAANLALHGAKISANVVGVILFMGLLNLVRELERARDVAVASTAEARTAKLEALQYQLRPHFLFNLLNTLAYLIRTDAPKARELTLELAEFLRYTLVRTEQETKLGEELQQLRRYVDLERARFGDGLAFDIIGPDADLAASIVVPPLILQPLVENAIRHGVVDGRVSVTVRCEREGDHLRVQVIDDGPGPQPQTDGSGVGLQNVRERLDRFYHGRAALELISAPDGGACAVFEVPIDNQPQTGLAAQARKRLTEVMG